MPIEREEQQVLSLNDYTGGINISVPPQALAENEYQLIQNLEFDMNRLRTRGGLSEPLAEYPSGISAFFYDNGTGEYLVCLVNGDVWEENFAGKHAKVGTLSGNRKPCFCAFDSKIFIASGGKLQYYSYQSHAVTTIEASYLCDYVFERLGRLVICHSGDDNLYYSATGDPYETGWTEDSNDDSTMKWLEIGYKDNGDILKALPIAGDVAVFKSNGRIYTLSGEYPQWQLVQTGENSDAVSTEAIVNVGSSIAFMANSGLRSLDAVQVYGNFTVNEIGRKFNKAFIGNIYEPRLYNIVRKRQLLIIPNTASEEQRKKVFCYQYDVGAGIYFEFDVPVDDAQDTRDGVIIASGSRLHRWDARYATDNGVPIVQEIVSRALISTRRIYSRRLQAKFVGESGRGRECVFTWAGKKVPWKLGRKRPVIEFFSVCSESALTMSTDDNIEIEYVNLYVTQK